MHDALVLTPWQAWVVALGGGFATIGLRVMPILAFRNIGSGAFRDVLDRTGFGIMGGLVAQTALASGQALFAAQGASGGAALGMTWAIIAVVLAFVLAVWRKWKLIATLVGMAFFVLGGFVFAA